MSYNITLISSEKANKYWKKLIKQKRLLYFRKVDINGCCIKLITDQTGTINTFGENFYHFGERHRSHGKLMVFDDKSIEGLKVEYEPYSRTVFIWNCDYYGYIKSLALSVAGDILEDFHDFHSLHGACLEYQGSGLGIVAPSGTGKTTLGYGIIRRSRAVLISDDWFFIRFQNKAAVGMSSEKNVYIRDNIVKDFEEFKPIIEKTHLDSKHRAVINIRDIVGAYKIREKTTLETIFTLKRDPSDSTIIRKMEADEMIEYLKLHDFCNPHLLVRDDRKLKIRLKFLNKLFKKATPYIVNTIDTSKKTIDAMLNILDK